MPRRVRSKASQTEGRQQELRGTVYSGIMAELRGRRTRKMNAVKESQKGHDFPREHKVDPNKMAHQNNPRAFRSPEKEDVAVGGQKQQHATQRFTRSRRRRCKQTTSDSQGRDQARALQVYKFKSRAPSTSVHCDSEGSLGLARIRAPTEDGKIMGMLARSASYWVQQEPARCWVRDCTGLACSAAGHLPRRHLLQHHLLGDEDSLTSLIKGELFSMDEGNNGSVGSHSRADVSSDDASRSFAEEYSLAPLNTRKKYSAQSFDQQVDNYFK